MNHLRVIFLALVLAGITAAELRAGPEGATTATPSFDDNGNKFRLIQTFPSTSAAVLVSGLPENAGLGIRVWRFREIVNMASGGMFIVPSGTYTAYSSTYGIHLASGPNGSGDSWIVPHQGEVWAIWHPATSTNGAGAGGNESYWWK